MTRPDGTRGTESESVGRRIGATAVDGLVVFALFYAGLSVVGGVTSFEPAVVLGFLFWFVFSVLALTPLLVLHGFSPVPFVTAVSLWTVYASVFEGLWGRTIGKRLFGLVVASEDGRSVTIQRVLVRNVLRPLDAVMGYGVGFLALAFTSRRQRIGDKIAGTVVVRGATGRDRQ